MTAEVSACRAGTIAAWGEPLPDWIDALVAACEARGQRAVAAQLGVSDSTLSMIRRRYGADPGAIEARVRGALLAATVACPVLGTLAADRCLDAQARRTGSANPVIGLLRAACPTCPHRRNV